MILEEAGGLWLGFGILILIWLQINLQLWSMGDVHGICINLEGVGPCLDHICAILQFSKISFVLLLESVQTFPDLSVGSKDI